MGDATDRSSPARGGSTSDKVRDRWDAYWARRPDDERDASWLSPWLGRLGSTGGPVLDLGCGGGADTEALTAAGLQVIALDYSRSALVQTGERAPGAHRVHYGARGHRAIEPHLYEVRGRPKRFFDRDDVDRFFGRHIRLDHVEHAPVGIEPEKHAWLIVGRR